MCIYRCKHVPSKSYAYVFFFDLLDTFWPSIWSVTVCRKWCVGCSWYAIDAQEQQGVVDPVAVYEVRVKGLARTQGYQPLGERDAQESHRGRWKSKDLS